MSRVNTFGEPPLIGYVTPLRGRPGQTLQFKISSVADRPFRAHTVRIDCADPNPQGPGMKLRPADFGLSTESYDGLHQKTLLGSYGSAPIAPLQKGQDVSVEFQFQPWLIAEKPQMVACLQTDDDTHGIGIVLVDGNLHAGIWNSEADTKNFDKAGFRRVFPLFNQLQLTNKSWYQTRLLVSDDTLTISMTPYWQGKVSGPIQTQSLTIDTCLKHTLLTHLTVGARKTTAGCVWHFNGRVGDISILAGESKPQDSWDFSANMMAFSIPNSVSKERPLTLFNAPMRAVRGLHWQGDEMVWKTAPRQYAAIHFHEDDLDDCNWTTSVELVIPPDMKSGVYGLVVTNETGTDTIPFYVLPAKSGPHAKVAYLASTLTYLAYGNHARGNFEGDLEQRTKEWNAYPHNPDRFAQFGFSTYNLHPDGHGINLSSRLRPLLTMRPGFLTFCDASGSGLRHFPADSHLTDWFDAKGIDYDVITDEDLHEEGMAALAPYQILVTGSHPEYHTRPMLEALLAFRRQGGHLAYLGGNGFYWKIGLGGKENHLLEIRRAEGGIRAWASEPGEYYHQLDGEYGGMWRRNGLPPQTVGAVGFAVQGLFEGKAYHRTKESRDPAVSWLFDNVSEEVIGDFGLSGGGAAGFELDQTDGSLGTPEGTVVVAVSNGHGPSFQAPPEEILTWTLPMASDRPYAGICAHMAYTPARDGHGSIFASGAIAFTGSLSHDNYQNPISTILHNYLSKCLLDSYNEE